MLGGVRDGVPHVVEAALVEEVDDELQLVHALKVGDLRLVAGLGEAALEVRDGPAQLRVAQVVAFNDLAGQVVDVFAEHRRQLPLGARHLRQHPGVAHPGHAQERMHEPADRAGRHAGIDGLEHLDKVGDRLEFEVRPRGAQALPLKGEVVRVLLLFYLSPIWTVLLGWWLAGLVLLDRDADSPAMTALCDCSCSFPQAPNFVPN